MSSDPLQSLANGASDTRTILRYPADYDGKSGNWLQFSRVKYEKPSILGDSVLTPSGAVIALPVPPNLLTSYTADWSNMDLGIAGAVVAKGAGTVASKIMEATKQGSVGDAIKSAYDSMKSTGFVNGGLNYMKAVAVDSATSTDIAAQLGIYGGFARNPHKAFVFNIPNFRSFEFTYKLVPRNKGELESIQAIIKEFKSAMLPSFNKSFEQNLFDYPDMYKMSFANEKYLFKFANCVLRNVGVDYHGEGTPAYVKMDDGKAPMSYILTLSFQETEILTREKIEEGY